MAACRCGRLLRTSSWMVVPGSGTNLYGGTHKSIYCLSHMLSITGRIIVRIIRWQLSNQLHSYESLYLFLFVDYFREHLSNSPFGIIYPSFAVTIGCICP